MTHKTDLTAQPAPVAVSSSGGGVSPQYRVQYSEVSERAWHRYASFRQREQAVACLQQLQQRGYRVRLVNYLICPAAA